MNNLHKLPHAPSVQLQEVPKQSLADILGRKPQDLEDDDEMVEYNPAALSEIDDRIQSSCPFSLLRVLFSSRHSKNTFVVNCRNCSSSIRRTNRSRFAFRFRVGRRRCGYVRLELTRNV